jgi:uncharacterized protein (TIGR03382 family)
MRFVTGLVASAAVLLAASTAQATVIYQTGFEAPEYATGALAGQNGWHVFGTGAAVTVDSAAPISGGQSAKVTGSLVTGQTGPWHTDASAIPQVTLSADILLTSSSAQRAWQFAALGPGLIGFSGGVNFSSGGGIFAITASSVPGAIGSYTRDTAHRIDLLLDYASQTYGVRFDGATLATDLAFCGGNFSCPGTVLPSYNNLLFDTFGVGGNDVGYLDNILVRSTAPEPATWTMTLMGFGGLGALLRRRRSLKLAA